MSETRPVAGSRPQRVPVGIRHMIAAAFYFSVMSLLVKLAGERLPSSQMVLVRAVICLVLSWVWLRRAGVSPWGGNPRALLLRGLLGTAGLVCFYYTLVTLPLAEAVVIAHTAPIFTAGLAAIILGERVDRRLFVAIACCATGIVAMVRPGILFDSDATSTLDPLGVATAFAGAFSSACAYVLIRKIGRRENPLVMVFYFPLVTLPVILPFAFTSWIWPSATEWLMLLGLGVATQMAQVHMTRGLTLVPAGRATTVGTIQVVLAAIWGALFFAEMPDLLTLGGALLVLGGTFALALPAWRGRGRGEDGIVGG